jgi:hypothetical protein
MQVFYLDYLTLKVEVISFSGMSDDFHRTTLRYIPEDSILHNHLCENLTSYLKYLVPYTRNIVDLNSKCHSLHV